MGIIKRNKAEKRWFVQEIVSDECYCVLIVDEKSKTYSTDLIVPAACVDTTNTGKIIDLDKFYDHIEEHSDFEEMLPHEYEFIVSGKWYKLPRNRKR